MLASLLAAAAPLFPPQETVVETRTLSGSLDLSALGLQSGTESGFGSAVRVFGSVDVTFELDALVTNTESFAGELEFSGSWNLGPTPGDCTPYDSSFRIVSGLGFLNPGASVQVSETWTETLTFDVTTFSPNCNSSQFWDWANLELFPDVTVVPGYRIGGANIGGLPSITVDGEVTFEWLPAPLPSTSVCPGSFAGGAPLMIGGSWDEPWFLQTGAPAVVTLLTSNIRASTTVPANGLCIAALGGPLRRVPGSIGVQAPPFRATFAPALSGTTQFFQTWFGTQGGATTGECISVTFP